MKSWSCRVLLQLHDEFFYLIQQHTVIQTHTKQPKKIYNILIYTSNTNIYINNNKKYIKPTPAELTSWHASCSRKERRGSRRFEAVRCSWHVLRESFSCSRDTDRSRTCRSYQNSKPYVWNRWAKSLLRHNESDRFCYIPVRCM